MGSRRITPEGRRRARLIAWVMMAIGILLIAAGLGYVLL